MTDTLSDALLRAIDANEGYWLPAGFEDEPLNTKLHQAVRHLILTGAITIAVRGGFNKWVRTKPH
jgi:hypothetical protein